VTTDWLLTALAAVLGTLAGFVTPDLVARLPERSHRDEPATQTDEPATQRDEPATPPDEPAEKPEPESGPEDQDRGRYADLAVTRARPLLAVLGAVVAGSLAWARAGEADLPAFVALGVLGVAMAFVDVRLHKLPDLLTLPALLVGAVLLGAAALAGGDADAYGRAWAGAAALFVVYFALAVVNPHGLGFGDVKLAAPLGLHLAWLGWSTLVGGAVLGFLVGGVIAIALLLTGRAGRRTPVPFGPAMLLGAWAAVLWGEALTRGVLGA
jgi:leader peptidase (prepilin peptidase)/N-methyltransferase